MTKTGLFGSARSGLFLRSSKPLTVKAMSGTVLSPEFLTLITSSDLFASFCLPGNVAFEDLDLEVAPGLVRVLAAPATGADSERRRQTQPGAAAA